VCGTLGEKVGWHYGFAAAGVGMAIGLFVLLAFQRVIGRAGLRDDQQAVSWKNLPVIVIWTVAAIVLIYAVLAAWPTISAFPVAGKVIGGLVLLALAIWLPRILGSKKEKKEAKQPLSSAEWSRVIVLCVVSAFSVVFWMGFEQAGGSMNLFADKQTERTLAGLVVPASWFQSINPALILLLAPFFSMLWTATNRSRFALPDTAKQGLGIIVLGLGFVVMYSAQMRADALGPVSPLWLASAYALHTVGELMLSPIGLALTSRAAPARITALMMGVWLLSSSVGSKLAGELESLMKGTGIQPYMFLTIVSIGAGVLLLALTPLLNRMIERRDPSEHKVPEGRGQASA
jgi:POT family proton-dependent oligopeptide transporter